MKRNFKIIKVKQIHKHSYRFPLFSLYDNEMDGHGLQIDKW